MKKINYLILFFSFALYCSKGISSESHSGSDRLEELDKKIVAAFNSSPKQTANVYLYSLEMINQSGKSSDKSEAWNLKARKLITLACYNEASIAVTNGNLKQALIWCERGLSRGAKSGKTSNYNISWFYDNLGTLKKQIELKLRGEGKSVSNYVIKNKADNSRYPQNRQNWKIEKRETASEKTDSYELLAGPTENAFGITYVLIRTHSKKKVQIKYYKNYGWGVSVFGSEPSQYFTTWEECARKLNKNN